MNWYLAKLIFRIICGTGEHHPQFDEQLRLVQGDNEKDALQKAYAIGYSNEENFLNHKGVPVQWKFVNVPELSRVNIKEDGAEIYSHIEEPDDADGYLSLAQHKATQLRKVDAPLLHPQIF